MLALNGEQGSAKSTTARMLRSLVDPRDPALRAEPREIRDLAIAARRSWLLVFDNISHLPQWLSDALCRLATGGGFATRKLYSDFDEVLFDAQRPVILTGITDYVVKDDLLDRTIQVTLSPIPDERRSPEKELWAAFEAAKPRLLGALLDDVSAALRARPAVQVQRLPRMVDFALWAVAAEQGREEPAAFMTAYARVRISGHEQALESSVIGTALRPELGTLLGEDPHAYLDRALRNVAERVGAGYRLTGGAPRQRGGRVPTVGQIRDVLDAVSAAPGFVGARNRAFFQILAETGARINALRGLDGADCVEMPSGRLRLFLHEKGKAEPREVELSRDTAAALHEYAQAFNYHAAVRRWGVRVRLGEPGPIWRNSPRGCWTYRDILETVRAGCVAAEIVPFTPHALRRAFATDASSVLPRHTVALAGGWKGLERLDDHYVQPRSATICEKLHRAERQADLPMMNRDGRCDTALTLQ